jgi:hypothetical protein
MFYVNIRIQAAGGNEMRAALQVDWRKSGALPKFLRNTAAI